MRDITKFIMEIQYINKLIEFSIDILQFFFMPLNIFPFRVLLLSQRLSFHRNQ